MDGTVMGRRSVSSLHLGNSQVFISLGQRWSGVLGCRTEASLESYIHLSYSTVSCGKEWICGQG